MSIYEYDQEKHMKMEREEHYTKGLKDGIAQGREEEMAHTERERKRADNAEARANNAEARLAEALEKIAQLENSQ